MKTKEPSRVRLCVRAGHAARIALSRCVLRNAAPKRRRSRRTQQDVCGIDYSMFINIGAYKSVLATPLLHEYQGIRGYMSIVPSWDKAGFFYYTDCQRCFGSSGRLSKTRDEFRRDGPGDWLQPVLGQT
eukprot:9328-Pleurochrysis_carterae.AAC.1